MTSVWLALAFGLAVIAAVFTVARARGRSRTLPPDPTEPVRRIRRPYDWQRDDE